MSNTRNIDLKSLNDTDNYQGVSPETRTAIIGAIGIDVEGLTTQEGGKFSEDELATGLRYLLVTNNELNSYIERSSNRHDAFYIPDIDNWMFAIALTNAVSPHHVHPAPGCPDCDGGSGEGMFIVFTLLASCACCIVTGYNVSKTLQSNESDKVKALKMLSNLLCFFLPASAAFAVALQWFDNEDPYYYVDASCIAVLVGAVAALVTSAINRIECASQPDETLKTAPSPELLAELETIKGILQGKYRKESDNPEAFRQFVQDVVRYYIHHIAKAPSLEVNTETTPLLSMQEVVIPNNPMRLFSPPPAASLKELRPQEEETNTPQYAASL